MWKNTENQWGRVSIIVHWLSALAVTVLFFLGLWMVDLSYYDSWYQTAPYLHKSLGVCLFLVILFRMLWRKINVIPVPVSTHTEFESKAARIVHGLIYLLLLLIMLSGYLISTADGRAIEVFGLFKVPALIYGLHQQEDIAGEVHFILAVSLMLLVIIHISGSLKHHFIDKDITLKRMLGIQ